MKNINLTSLKPYTRQLVMLIIASITSVSILGIGYAHHSDAQLKNEQAMMLHRQLSRETDQLRENKDFLNKTGTSFDHIKVQGFFGEEDRLSWSEALKTTAQRLKLPSLKYSIRPQQQLQAIGSGYSPTLSLSQSIMDIEADLLHEGDFITLSEQLSEMPGLFRVFDCELTKEKEILLSQPNMNISLKCSLAWHTVKLLTVEDGEIFEDDIDLGFM